MPELISSSVPLTPPPHNLFGDYGPRCPACSGLGRYLSLGSSGRPTRSTSRCICGGTGVDQDIVREQRYESILERLNKLELEYAKELLRKSPKLSRQSWEELIAWATQDGTAIANTTTEAIIFPNLTVPANYMQDGRAMRSTLSGRVGATGTPTLTFKIRWGGVSGTILAQTAAVTLAAVTAAIFRIELEIQTRSNGSSGSLFVIGQVNWGATIKTTNTPDMMGSAGATVPAAVTADLTADTALSITADWSAADASNSLTGHNYLLESLN